MECTSLMPGLKRRKITKKEVAKSLGIARSTLYYDSKLQKKDWDLKIRIEEVLHIHPAYGHKRLAIALGINKKRIRRVMHLFGIKPYRRRPKKLYKERDRGAKTPYPNLLMAVFPGKTGCGLGFRLHLPAVPGEVVVSRHHH